MSNRVVDIDPFSPSSLRRAQKILDEEWRDFNRKVDQFLVELAEYGAQTAQHQYGESITVSVEHIPNGYAVIANGEKVGFLEFGAGATAIPNIFAEQVPYEVRPGSWSETHAQQYSSTLEHFGLGWWEFGGTIYYEVIPRNGMLAGWGAVQRDWRMIAERVFS